MPNITANNGGFLSTKENLPSLDLRYGPYESLAAAHAALAEDELCAIGLTVGIIENGDIVEYWYQGGTELGNLERKQTGGTGEDAYTIDAQPSFVAFNVDSTGAVTEYGIDHQKTIEVYGRVGRSTRTKVTITGCVVPVGFTVDSITNGTVVFHANQGASLATSSSVVINFSYNGLNDFSLTVPLVPNTAGKDADNVEWIYKYNASGYDGSTGQVGPSGAASGSDTNKQQDDWVPNGWYDEALSISSTPGEEVVYASYRIKNGSTHQWGAFTVPIVWSNWGHTGTDGDGVEYVFVRTKDNVKPAVPTSEQSSTYCEKNTGDNSYLLDDHLPYVRVTTTHDISGSTSPVTSGGYKYVKCTDDPVGITNEWPYEWVIKRTKSAPNAGVRTWNAYVGDMSLWSNWSNEGNGIATITKAYAISAHGTPNAGGNYPDDIGEKDWQATSPEATAVKPYLWVKETITFTQGEPSIKYYCTGKYGDNGIDAKDTEWIYVRTDTNTPPTIVAGSGENYWKVDDYCPQATVSNGYIKGQEAGSTLTTATCTDDPQGVNDTWKYEWEMKRTKGAAQADGSREWNNYTPGAAMTLHNNYAESAFIIDTDNDNDQFGVDSTGTVRDTQTRSTKVTVYDGSQPQVLASLTVTLTDENGTALPTTNPTDLGNYVSANAVAGTGVVSVTILQDAVVNISEIQAHITATVTGKGNKTTVFTLHKVMGGVPGITPIIYQLAPTNKVFSFQRGNSNTLTPNSRSSQINVARTEGSITTIHSSQPTGTDLVYSWGFDEYNPNSPSPEATNQIIGSSISVTNTQAASHSAVWVRLSNGDLESLAIVKDGIQGLPGNNSVRVDLDNQADIVAVDSDGKVRFERTVTVKARIYEGGTLKTTGVSFPVSVANYKSGLAITAGGTTVTPKLYHTSVIPGNEITTGNAGTAISGGVLFIVWTFEKNVQLSANTTWPKTIQLRYLSFEYDAAFSLTTSDTDAVYQVMPVPSEVSFTRDGNNTLTPSEISLRCDYTKATGSGTETITNPQQSRIGTTPYYLYYRVKGNNGSWGNWTSYTGALTVYATDTNTDYEFGISTATSAGNVQDSNIFEREVIPVVKDGISGTSPYIADLDNEMDSVACNLDGNPTASSTCSTNLNLFYGSSKVPFKISGITRNNSGTMGTGVTVKIDDVVATSTNTASQEHNVKVVYATTATISGKDDFAITLTDAEGNNSRILHFTINEVKPGENGDPATIYNILPSASSISVGRTENGGYSPSTFTLTCGYTRNQGGAQSTVADVTGRIDATYNLYFRKRSRSTGNWETSYYLYYYTSGSTSYKARLVNQNVADYNAVEFILCSNYTASTVTASTITSTYIIDKETIPILADGRMGDPGIPGKNAVRLAIDNEHEDFVYNAEGKVAPTNAARVTATIYDGLTPIPGENVNWWIDTTQTSGTEVKNSGNPTTATYTGDCTYIGPLGDLKVNGLTADSATITIKAEYPKSSGAYYYAAFTANKTMQDKFDIILKPSSLSLNIDDPWEYTDITPSMKGTDIQGNAITNTTILTIRTSVPSTGTGFVVWYAYVNSNGTLGTMNILGSSSFRIYSSQIINNDYIGVYFELRQYNGSSEYRVCDYDTVEIATAANGKNNIRLGLDNEHEDFLYSDTNTSPIAPQNGAQSQARLYDGPDPINSGISWSISASSGVVTNNPSSPYYASVSSSGLLTVKGINAESASVTVRATYPTGSTNYYYATFTANRTKQDKYDLIFSDNAIAYNPEYFVTNKRITIYANVTNLSGVTSVATINTGTNTPAIGVLRLWAIYKVSGSQVETQVRSTVTESGISKLYFELPPTIAADNDGIRFELRKYTAANVNSYTVEDYETIEIAKSENGAPGDSYRIKWFYVNTPNAEVHEVVCEDDWTCDLAAYNNLSAILQKLVDGVWTSCGDYYVATRMYDAGGICRDGYNSNRGEEGAAFNATTKVNVAIYHYYEIYFVYNAQPGAATDGIPAADIFMSSRIYKLPKGSSAYQFDIKPYVMSWNTDADGYILNYDYVTGTTSAYKGGELMLTPAITAASGMIRGFTLDRAEDNSYFQVTPHEYFTSYTYSSTTYYIMKRAGQYSVNDLVYDTSMLKVGYVSATSSNGPTITLDSGGTRALTRGTQNTPVFDEPVTVTLTLQSGAITRDVTLTLIPTMQGYNGHDAVRLDLNNEHDSILYSGSTKVGEDVTSQATLYVGGVAQSASNVGWSIYSSSGMPSDDTGRTLSSGLITVKQLTALHGVVVVQAKYPNNNSGNFYYATFSVDKVIDKPKYEISVDKSAIVINTDTTSASQSLVVRIWKSEINSSGGITRTNITSLGNDLKLFYQVGNYQPGTVSYSSGSGTVSSITSEVSQVTIWLTDSTGSSSSKVTGLLDIETVPVAAVQNGTPGLQGKMGRNIYYAGTIQEVGYTQFIVTDYEAPYVQTGVDSYGNPVCYVFVGENSDSTPYIYPAYASAYASSDDWEQMTSEYKYLITNAVFSDFAKLGSGVFNGDYAFSQWGTMNGGSSDDYQYFVPNSAITGTFTGQGASEPLIIWKFVGNGGMCTFHFDVDKTDNTASFFLDTSPTHYNPVADWTLSSTSFDGRYPVSGGVTYYLMMARHYSSSVGNINYTITCTTNNFQPNLYINWLRGEIYAQLGRFVNVTVEGVINNLDVNINETNYSDYGSRSGSGQTFWLNPTKVGNLVRYNCNSPLGLPSAWYEGAPDVYTISSGGVSITLDELRQCIGKKIYLYTADNNNMQSFYCGIQGNGMFVCETGHPTIEDIPATGESMTSDVEYSRTYQYASQQSMQNSFFILECMLGEYNNHECIYWSITRSAFRMDYLDD